MTQLTFDFDTVTGRIKPMHAVGQPPMYGLDASMMHYLAEAHIPYSRMHDVGGMFSEGVFVDVPNIFHCFDADENDEASYDFVFTDKLFAELLAVNCKPFYRLGVSIENYQAMRAYRLDPPKDFHKWARVCEHIIRHYNEGWANGFHMGLEYFEIWNEPDFAPEVGANQMWHGTENQFFELFDITARHLKTVFGDTVRVGGYASCGFYYVAGDPRSHGLDMDGVPGDETYIFHPVNKHRTAFFDRFIDYIAEKGTPMDFFSFHSYGGIRVCEIMLAYARKKFDGIGRNGIEMILDEWNNANAPTDRGTSRASANACAMMLDMQSLPIDMLCYYDARLGVSKRYAGMFNPLDWTPLPVYFAFKAFGELYALGNEIQCDGTVPYNLYAAGAADGSGKKAALISNVSGLDKVIKTNLDGTFAVYLIDKEHPMEKTALDPGQFILPKDGVAHIANY